MAVAEKTTPDQEDTDLDPGVSTDTVDEPTEVVDEGSSADETVGDDEFGGASDEEVAFARANGWSGREKWRGDPTRFETAKAFAERSKGINSILQRENASLRRDMDQIRKDVADWKAMETRRMQREFDERAADLRARRVQAISEGDGAAVDKAERELAELGQRPAEPKPAATQPNALTEDDRTIAEDFATRNPWIKNDGPAADVAMALSMRIKRERPDLTGNVRGFLAELETRMRRDHAALIGETSMPRTARTEGGSQPSRRTTKPRAKTFEDMPKDAQEACDRLVRTGMVKKREDYVKNYFDSYGEAA
jgi:hypothetical protein